MSTMFIRFEEPAIAGTSTIPGHEKEIDVLSWNQGMNTSLGEQPAHTLSFTKYMDAVTNELLKYSWSGKQIGKAVLTCYRTDVKTDNKLILYLTIIMHHAVIENYSVSGRSGDTPVENISLAYGVIEYHYIEKNANGAETTTRSVKHNRLTGAVE